MSVPKTGSNNGKRFGIVPPSLFPYQSKPGLDMFYSRLTMAYRKCVDFYNNRRPHVSINTTIPKLAAGFKGANPQDVEQQKGTNRKTGKNTDRR